MRVTTGQINTKSGNFYSNIFNLKTRICLKFRKLLNLAAWRLGGKLNYLFIKSFSPAKALRRKERSSRELKNKVFVKKLLFSLSFSIVFLSFFSNSYAQQTPVQKFDEKQLKVDFDKFIESLDALSITNKYPEITKKILSADKEQQLIAIRMLSVSEDSNAIPWMVLLLESNNINVRTNAGLAIENIIASSALKRRDPGYPQYVLIKPLEKEDLDLKPLAWIVLQLLRTDSTNLCAYAITMARYLNLYEFQDEILKHRTSIHPAITDKVKWAIKSFRLQKKYESGELQALAKQK